MNYWIFWLYMIVNRSIAHSTYRKKQDVLYNHWFNLHFIHGVGLTCHLGTKEPLPKSVWAKPLYTSISTLSLPKQNAASSLIIIQLCIKCLGVIFPTHFWPGEVKNETWTGRVRFNALSVLKMWPWRKKVKLLSWKPWLLGWIFHVLCSSVLRFMIILELDWSVIYAEK